jgi:hypothetical protein
MLKNKTEKFNNMKGILTIAFRTKQIITKMKAQTIILEAMNSIISILILDS